MKCSNCGNECNNNAKFCDNCGSKLSIEEISNINNKEQEPTMPATDEEETFKDEKQTKTELTLKEKLKNFINLHKRSIRVSGIIFLVLVFIISFVFFLCFILPSDELGYPLMAIIPRIEFLFAMIGSIIGIIAFCKYNKKLFITSISLLLVSCILFPVARFVNGKIMDSLPPQHQTVENKEEETTEETTTELITETTTEPTTVDPEYLKKQEKEFKNSCKTYSYKTLEREPDKYKEKHVKFTGEVIQAVDSDFMCQYRIDVTKSEYGNYTDTIYVTYFPKDGDKKILEDDIVTLYGYFDGMYTYQSTMGATVTVPKVSAEYIQIDKMAE